MSLSEQIAKYVVEQYVRPARQAGARMIEVRAGEVHRGLGWKNRVTSVCTTLESQKFQRENNLHLFHTSGPASGRSTTVAFAYQLLDRADEMTPAKPARRSGEKLKALYGLCANTFKTLGGGENFLRRERNWGADAWERYEAEAAPRRAKRKDR
jgi:hypothetical protein